MYISNHNIREDLSKTGPGINKRIGRKWAFKSERPIGLGAIFFLCGKKFRRRIAGCQWSGIRLTTFL